MDPQLAETRPPARQPSSPPPLSPLLPWAVGLMAGILIDGRMTVSPSIALLVLSVLVAIVIAWGFSPRRKRPLRSSDAAIVAFAAAACIGALRHHQSFHEMPARHIASFTTTDKCLARVTGRVVSPPNVHHSGYAPFEPWLFGQDRTSFILAADTIEAADGPRLTCGKVRVSIREPALAITEGARVQVFGWLYRPRGPQNPGEFDWSLFHARRGVRAAMACDSAACASALERSDDRSAWTLVRIRDRVRRMLHDDRLETGAESVSLLDAMVLGRRSAIDQRLEQSFIATGCAHYLAVSGIHVAMLVAAVWYPTRRLGLGRRPAAGLTILVVVAYALVVDPRSPVMRAAIVTCAFCTGVLLRRRGSPAGALALAAIVILFVDPPALFDVGFQLSFITVAGLIYLTPAVEWALLEPGRRIHKRFKNRGADNPIDALAIPGRNTRAWWKAAGRGTWTALCVAVTAWVCSTPVVAGTFGRIAPWGWLNSLLVLPIVFAVMVLGFLKLAAGAVLPVLAEPFGFLMSLPAEILAALLSLLERLPGTTLQVSAPPWWVSVSYYLLLLAVVGLWRCRIRPKWAWAAAIALVVTILTWRLGPIGREDVRITQLAVGRATSTVIELPGGRAWLYDVGGSGSFDPAHTVVLPFLTHARVRAVEGIILSHPNLDHFGGVPSLLDSRQCGPIWVSPYFESLSGRHSPSRALLDEIAKREHPMGFVRQGDRLELCPGAVAEILWPANQAPPGIDANDTSIVMRLTANGRSVLFTGDLGPAAQAWLIEHVDLSADVLMLPHHGAVESTTAAFIQAVGAKYLVRSSSDGSAESPELESAAAGMPIHNTADHGAVEIVLDARGIQVSGFTDSKPD